jgi:hypothetical protein
LMVDKNECGTFGSEGLVRPNLIRHWILLFELKLASHCIADGSS